MGEASLMRLFSQQAGAPHSRLISALLFSLDEGGADLIQEFQTPTPEKETHNQMQRAYLRGQRKPLPVTSVDTKSWIQEGIKHERSAISKTGERRRNPRKD